MISFTEQVSKTFIKRRCSAGLGRASVLAAIYFYQLTGKDQYKIVSEMRKCRAGAIQNTEQCKFVISWTI